MHINSDCTDSNEKVVSPNICIIVLDRSFNGRQGNDDG